MQHLMEIAEFFTPATEEGSKPTPSKNTKSVSKMTFFINIKNFINKTNLSSLFDTVLVNEV